MSLNIRPTTHPAVFVNVYFLVGVYVTLVRNNSAYVRSVLALYNKGWSLPGGKKYGKDKRS